MINLVFDGAKETKPKERNYLIGTLDGLIHEADTLEELVAVICGREYVDCEERETAWIVRMKAAQWLAMSTMMNEEMAEGFLDDEDEDIDRIVVWDVREACK